MKVLINKGQYGWFIPVKNEDYKTKEELKSYINVRFIKGTEPKSNAQIELKNAFFSNFKKKDGNIGNELVIMEYELIKEFAIQEQIKEPELTPINEGDLPF